MCLCLLAYREISLWPDQGWELHSLQLASAKQAEEERGKAVTGSVSVRQGQRVGAALSSKTRSRYAHFEVLWTCWYRGGMLHLGIQLCKIMHKAWQSCGQDRGQEKDWAQSWAQSGHRRHNLSYHVGSSDARGQRPRSQIISIFVVRKHL